MRLTTLGTLFLFLFTRKLYHVSSFIRSNKELMDLLKGIKIDWSFEVRHRGVIDFTDTFSPVIKLTIVKCLITLVIKRGWTIF